MRLYKILNRYVDLDFIVSITEPYVSIHSDCLAFEIKLYQDEPMLIKWSPKDGFKEWKDQYFNSNPSLVRHNCEEFVYPEYAKTRMPEFQRMQNELIQAWKNLSIDQQLAIDKDIYGVAYERMFNGRRERIDPTTIRVHNYKRQG